MAKKAFKFPATIYVKYEQDGDEHYFVANEKYQDLAELSEDALVGEYALVQSGVVVAAPEFLVGVK